MIYIAILVKYICKIQLYSYFTGYVWPEISASIVEFLIYINNLKLTYAR